MDFDNESLLRCFCSEEEEQTIIAWNKENGHARSDIFEFSIFGWKDLPCGMPQRPEMSKTYPKPHLRREHGLTVGTSGRIPLALMVDLVFWVWSRREGVRLRVRLVGLWSIGGFTAIVRQLYERFYTFPISWQPAWLFPVCLSNQGLEEADKLRAQGNEFFNSGDFETARQRYYGAIWHLDFDIGQQWNLMDKHQLDLNTRCLGHLAGTLPCDFQ